MNIVIIGYRAAGKSTVGQRVAQRLGWPYLDIDRGIEARCQTTLAEFFARDPEQFRAVETEVAIEMCSQDQRVISFGAGSLIKQPNQEAACRNSLVVYLKASVQELWRRIQADPGSAANRPKLSRGGIEEVAEMLAAREPVYLQCADLILDATLPPDQLATAIIAACDFA
jgi:shikimate kinase